MPQIGLPCPCPDGLECTQDIRTVCWTHYVHELDTPESYRVCLECGHVFQTTEELLKEYNELNAGSAGVTPPLTDATKVYHCPHCIHDFLGEP